VIAAATIHPLLIKGLNRNAKLPICGSDLAVGIDIIANQEVMMQPHQRAPIGTGIALAARSGTYIRITLRSGLAVKHGMNIGVGVINEDYRAEIKVVLINNSTILF
jgi:dUTP pyrophosphatase